MRLTRDADGNARDNGSSASVQRYESALYLVSSSRNSGPVEAMMNWSFHRFNPAGMKEPQPIRREYRLSETGDNLSGVIHILFSDGHTVLDDIVDFVRACVPTVEKLIFPIYGEAQTYVALKERLVPKAIGSWGLV